MYRVRQIFDGNNLLANGMHMEAYYVEDNGDGICFNVFVYNVQPKITIDYAIGESSYNESSSESTIVKPDDTTQTQSATYILKKYKENSSAILLFC